MNDISAKLLRDEVLQDITEQNSARKVAGLPLLKITVRTCMVCGSQFQSVSRRICCNPDVPYLLDSYSISPPK